MTDEKQIVKAEQTDLSRTEYGSREDIALFARRVKTMLPGGERLTDNQALAIGQYSLLTGANPFRGEIYGFVGRNGFVLVEGYKLLVRWARRQCPYTELFKPIPVPDGDVGFKCYILREDQKPILREMIALGAPFEDAWELATTSASGVVRQSEMQKRGPPTGWTWQDVAKKRALKNALNLSHGLPSPQEIARETWDVNGIQTQASDWQDVTPEMSQAEREAVAEYNAKERQRREAPPLQMTATEAIAELFEDEAAEQYEASVQTQKTPDQNLPFPNENEKSNKNGRSWPHQIIDHIIAKEWAKNRANAVNMLNLSAILSDKDELDLIAEWCIEYRSARKVGDEPETAAAFADSKLKGIVEE